MLGLAPLDYPFLPFSHHIGQEGPQDGQHVLQAQLIHLLQETPALCRHQGPLSTASSWPMPLTLTFPASAQLGAGQCSQPWDHELIIELSVAKPTSLKTSLKINF